MKDVNLRMQEAQLTPSRVNSATHSETHSNKIVEISEERNLKAERGKQLVM